MVNSGLLNDYWRQYRQKRINTGIGMTRNEVLGGIDAGLAHERQMAQIANENSLRQQQMDIQKDQIRKQDRAATVSGVANLGQMAGNLYLGKGLLDVYRGNASGLGQPLTGSVPPAGNLVEQSAMSTGTMPAPIETGAVPAASPVSVAAPSPLMVGGQAAGLMSAQMATADLLKEPMQKLGLHYTQKYGKFGGVPGMGVGLPMDIANLGRDLLKSIF